MQIKDYLEKWSAEGNIIKINKEMLEDIERLYVEMRMDVHSCNPNAWDAEAPCSTQ